MIESMNTNTKSSEAVLKELPRDFAPSPYSVIIGRAKECKQSAGNRRLRIMATAYLPQYASAINRSVKSQVVSHIVSMVRQACGSEGGAFIKKVGKAQDGNTIWVEVSDSAAREKIGYVFRDLLADQYRSSSKSKSMSRLRRQRAEMQQSASPSSSQEPALIPAQQDRVESAPGLSQLSQLKKGITSNSMFDFVSIPTSLIAMAKHQNELSELLKASTAGATKPDVAKSFGGGVPEPTPFFSPAVRRKSDVAWIEVMAENLQDV